MDFAILGWDVARFDADSPGLDDAHWAYFDRVKDDLVARGPILSDAAEHRGSIHIVRLNGYAEAERFARDEPYSQAGVYETVEIHAFENLLNATMWERERIAGVDTAWVAIARWPVIAELAAAELVDRFADVQSTTALVFCGLLRDRDGGTTGIVAGFDAVLPQLPASVRKLIQTIAPRLQPMLTVRRWRRGGRPQA